MKATFNTSKVKGFNSAHRKEKGFYCEYLVITKEMKQVITLRLYATQVMSYAGLWVHGGKYPSGSGKAGGYGYHRGSAATAEAVESAGYVLDKSISGVGESAMKEALLAICELEGFKDVTIFEAHA